MPSPSLSAALPPSGQTFASMPASIAPPMPEPPVPEPPVPEPPKPVTFPPVPVLPPLPASLGSEDPPPPQLAPAVISAAPHASANSDRRPRNRLPGMGFERMESLREDMDFCRTLPKCLQPRRLVHVIARPDGSTLRDRNHTVVPPERALDYEPGIDSNPRFFRRLIRMTTDRRTFLQLVSTGALAAAFPASIKRALAIPAHHRTGTIDDVEHIVILMQENRSFDHYFGTLRGVRGFGDPRAVDAAHRRAGVAPAERRRLRAAVPSRRAEPRACSSSRTCRTTGRPRTRPGTAASTTSGCRPRARPRWPTSRATTSRSTTRWPTHSRSATPTTARCWAPTDPEPLSHVDRLGRQRRQRRRPGARQRRGRLRLVDLSRSACRAAGISWKIYQDVGRRPRRRALLGLGRRRRTSATTATTRCSTSTSTRTRSRAARSSRAR